MNTNPRHCPEPLTPHNPLIEGWTDGQACRVDEVADRAGVDEVAGAPCHRREVEREFWCEIATGLLPAEAADAVGASQAVGSRWFRHGGGMPPMDRAQLAGRYLSFAERAEIALLRARGFRVRQIARELNRAPSTISREIRTRFRRPFEPRRPIIRE